MKMATSAIMLVIAITVVYAVIQGASTGTWSTSVISLVVIIPLIMIAGFLAKAAGMIGD
jgi:hypothetical protein